MSDLRFWSLRLLFVWQLLWLLVQAAPIQRVALDPSLLTSIPTRPTEPWLSEQQVPPPNIYDDSESSLYVSEASAPTMEFPGQMESSATKEDISTKTSNDMVTPPYQPGIPAEDLEKIEWSPFQQETLGKTTAEAVATELQPLGGFPEDPEVTGPHPEPVQAPQQTFSDIMLPHLDLELTMTPKPTVDKHPTAVTPPTAPPKHPKLTFPHPKPVHALQHTLSGITVPPLDLELILTRKLIEVEHATVVTPPTAPQRHPEVTFTHPEPVRVQQPTVFGITVPPMELELTETPEATEEEPPPAVTPPIAPPKNPKVTFPYLKSVQHQQATLSEVTVPHLDLELTITPKPAIQTELSEALKLPTAPTNQPKVTFPHPEPVQAQQATLPEVTIPHLDLELTITPKPTVEEHPTSVTPPSALPTHPEVTVPHQEPVQSQQPTLSGITFPPLDLELTMTPEATVEEQATALTPPTAPPMHPEVTFPYPEPVQAQQATLPEVTIPHLDLELTITPKPTVEEHPTSVTPPSALPTHPEVTVPHQEPVQSQQPTLSGITFPPLDLELTITQEATVEEFPTAVTPPTPPPMHPEVTFTYPEPVQPQQATLPGVTVPPLDLELTITPKPTMEAELPVALHPPTAPPKQPEMTFPQADPVQAQEPALPEVTAPHVDLELTITPELTAELKHPVALQLPTAPAQLPTVMFPRPESTQAQQPTLSDVTSPPLNLELTVTPEPSVETEHPTAPQLSTAPPKYPEVTVLVQVQQPTQGEVQVSDVGLFRMQQPETSEAGPPTTGQKLPMDICELCACYGSTLSCTGLSPEQKLRSVPVLYPNIYNHSFTIVNLQGNAISHIDKNTWKSYHLLEKLILSDNNLKELHKDSFEGLLSLQYLDLSSNKIPHIERNTFDSVPFLQHLNLQNNLMTTVSFGTFQAWHGMQFLHHLILSHNPLTTVEDPYLFKLRKLQYLDMGKTQVSLTTVERILMTTLNLEKLILPSHLVCCLCQFKKNIEAVSKTVKLNCDSDCLTNTRCDEELHLGRTEGSFMKILQGREENNCPQLTIEPERASSGENGDSFAALTNILKEFLSEQEAVKVSKVDWDTGGWRKGTTEAQGEEDEHKSRELTQEVPGYGYKYKLFLAAPVIVVASFFTVLFLLILICHKQPSEECKEKGDFFSSLGYERSLEKGGSWSRRRLSFWERHWPFNIMCARSEEQYLYPKDHDSGFSHMEKGDASMSTARVATLPSAGEETDEESEA